MSVQSYLHYKKVLVEGGALGLYPLRAALMDSAYVFSENHKALTLIQGLIVDDVPLGVSTSYSLQGQYTVWPEPVLYENVNAKVSGVVVYVDGFVTGVFNPMLWYCGFSESDLLYTDLKFRWKSPLFTW